MDSSVTSIPKWIEPTRPRGDDTEQGQSDDAGEDSTRGQCNQNIENFFRVFFTQSSTNIVQKCIGLGDKLEGSETATYSFERENFTCKRAKTPAEAICSEVLIGWKPTNGIFIAISCPMQ